MRGQQLGERCKMKRHGYTILLFLALIAGLSLLLYPTVSDWWNSFHQSQMIAAYDASIKEIDQTAYQQMLADAEAFNQSLSKKGSITALTDEQRTTYYNLLDVSKTGVMSYVEIPSLRILLPIYHGTDDGILEVGIGHLEGTSLPIGGEGTHCVISGHRGLPSAQLFTNIDQLVEGDEFMLHTLNEVLTYEVDQIQIILPYELSSLQIDPDEDYCTLVTCTPYGVNTHRLLVRGHRIDTKDSSIARISADALQIRPIMVAPFIAMPILLVLLILLFTVPKKQEEYDDDDENAI